MDTKIALVTGGAGFIGHHLVQKLIDRGWKVRIIDIADTYDQFSSQVDYVQGSILDDNLVRYAMQDVDEVYHLAAIPDLWARDERRFYQINTLGTQTILREAADARIKNVVYTSSEVVLKGHENGDSVLIDEATPQPALSEMPGPYSRSKWLADNEARKAAAEGLPVTIVYPTTPVGPEDINLTPPTKMIRDFLNGESPAYLNCMLNIVPVQEVAEGHILAAKKRVRGGRYILGNKNMSLKRFLEIIELVSGKKMPNRAIPYSISHLTAVVSEFISNTITHKKPIASVEGVKLAGSRLTFDSKKARTQLGVPAYSVTKAIQSAIQWLNEQDYVRDVANSFRPSSALKDYIFRSTDSKLP